MAPGPQDILWVLVVALGLKLAIQGLRLRSPESALGVALVLMGAGAAVFRMGLAGNQMTYALPGIITVNLGTVFMAVFTAWTFHPGSRAAFAGVVASTLLLAGGIWHQLQVADSMSAQIQLSPVMVGTRALVLAWPVVSAAWFRRIYARRAVLGLADPVVVNRFLLFAAWNGTLALMPVAVLVITALAGTDGGDWRRVVLLPAMALWLLTIVGIWLTFLPPEAYLRRVRGGAPPTDDHANTGSAP